MAYSRGFLDSRGRQTLRVGGGIGLVAVAAGFFTAIAGCDSPSGATSSEEAPRAVSVMALRTTDPGQRDRVAGSVTPWKTERIGFEVAGRVVQVVEPDTHVQGRSFMLTNGGKGSAQAAPASGRSATEPPLPDAQADTPKETFTPNLLHGGTLLARLDDTRYRVTVESVKAQIQAKLEQKKSIQVEIDSVIPAEETAAQAELAYARAELERAIEVYRKGAISRSEYDRSRADWEKARAQIAQLAARKEARRAELGAIDAQVNELRESQVEAERDVADCRLFAPYDGQVADVHAVPGAYLERGQPVLTLQMLDPIAIEFEVSADTARAMDYREMVPVVVPQPDGTTEQLTATVYIIDPVADPQTRTFTVTLLARNRLMQTRIPDDMQGEPLVKTQNIWRVVTRLPDADSALFIEKESIQTDDQGPLLWKITNRDVTSLADQTSAKLEVTKVRINLGDRMLPFMGVWSFREFSLAEGEQLNPDADLVAGKVVYPEGIDASTFRGGAMLFERERWLLRPGEVVEIALRGRPVPPGFYVPANLMATNTGRQYVFAAESTDQGAVARRIEVRALDEVDTLRRIEAVGERPLRDGMSLVAGGALLLVDGEPINIVEQQEAGR